MSSHVPIPVLDARVEQAEPASVDPVRESLIPKVFAWIDVETTGLNPHRDLLLEVAMILTDSSFVSLAKSQHTVRLSTPELRYAEVRMDPVVARMHKESGLWLEISEGVGEHLSKIDRALVALIRRHVGVGGPLPWLAGNSITLDRGFISAKLPLLSSSLHHRSLDMTSVYGFEECVGAVPPPRAPRGHRAMSDIESALGEARALRSLRLHGDGSPAYPHRPERRGTVYPFRSRV